MAIKTAPLTPSDCEATPHMTDPRYILRGEPIPGGKLGEPKLGYADFPRLLAKIEAHPEMGCAYSPRNVGKVQRQNAQRLRKISEKHGALKN